MARVKTKDDAALQVRTDSPSAEFSAGVPLAGDALAAFDALSATAGIDSRAVALSESGADTGTLEAALTDALRAAHDRWGLGLHHLRHEARLLDGGDVALLVDGREAARLGQGYAAVAQAYAPMGAADERGLSLWGVLGEGHRVAADAPFAVLKVLIEEARDFETHWAAGRGGAFSRAWRSGETLHVEVARPASAEEALADAAWDVITGIKDRAFQRELMRRSEEAGMLGALLAARHAGASSNLARLPEAQFAVQAVVRRLTGAQARNAEAYRSELRAAAAELDELQAAATRQLSEVLRHGLTR